MATLPKGPGGLLMGIAVPRGGPPGPSGPSGSMGGPGGANDPDDELALAAAGELLTSIKKGNARGVLESFRALKDACASYDGPGEESAEGK